MSKINEAISQIKRHCGNTACYDCIFSQDKSEGCMFHNKPYEWFISEKLEDDLDELEKMNED